MPFSIKKAFNSIGKLMERLGDFEKAINYYSNGDTQGDYIGNFFIFKVFYLVFSHKEFGSLS